VGHACTRQHVPERRLPTHTNASHASHASSSPEWQTRPTKLTRIIMTSAWHNYDVNMQNWHAMSATSQLTRQHSGTHQPRHQPRAKLSWAEPSWSRAASQGIGSSVADSTYNRIWDWIWAIDKARIVLIKF